MTPVKIYTVLRLPIDSVRPDKLLGETIEVLGLFGPVQWFKVDQVEYDVDDAEDAETAGTVAISLLKVDWPSNRKQPEPEGRKKKSLPPVR